MTARETERATLAARLAPVPAGYARGLRLPWWLKLGARLALAGLGRDGQRALGVSRAPPEPAWLIGAPELWMARAQEVLGRRPRSLLEIGPGRMLLRAPVLAAMGFERIWHAEAGGGAPLDPAPYRAAAKLARERGLPAPDLAGCRDHRAVLARCRTSLLAGGPAMLSAIPDGAVDLVVSETALEHVRREELVPLLAQLRRVTAPDGLGLHWIDFHDHLSGGLQHLRFSNAFWASPLVGRAGIYLNRLGLSGFVFRFRRAGFSTVVPEAMVWPIPPPGPRRPHPEAMRPAGDDLVCRALLEVRPGG
ncbi:MAG: class I SAM-dependent methyltransferase [Acetobacteraceae bacterium]|nr:class I SAM-dependent methyltransferase [Acetobacteraceae bacterium]